MVAAFGGHANEVKPALWKAKPPTLVTLSPPLTEVSELHRVKALGGIVVSSGGMTKAVAEHVQEA